MPRALRLTPILLGLFIVSLFVSWLLWGKPWAMTRGFVASRLERVLPSLEQSKLEAYRNQSWCKNIAYNYGKFSETSHPTTCNLFGGTPQTFDEQATRDFRQWQRTFLLTGVRILFVNVYYKGETVRLAEFHLACWVCSRTRYVYEPNYTLQENVGGEMWFDAIDENWYVVNEDWN